MSYVIGTGGEDWVELDMDLVDRRRTDELQMALLEQAEMIEEVVGGNFDLELAHDDCVFIVIEGTRRYQVEVNNDDRIVLTGILDPEGPL